MDEEEGKINYVLMAFDLIRRAFMYVLSVTAFTVEDLQGVGYPSLEDVNASARVLLKSSKPSRHTNIDCLVLVAVTISRQVSVVRLPLQ
ncbi:hypothetical protein Tco_1073779, partial [Tanacetum coccineum]